MDFLKILRSLEEFLYEVMTWLLFFPITLWRIVAQPSGMIRYADQELYDKDEDQFTDAISPPLFLMLTIVVAHSIEVLSGSTMFTPDTPMAKAFFASDQNLLLYRSIMFSIWPLVGASTLLRLKSERIDRLALRRPFFAQCYIAAPFALAFACGSAIQRDQTRHLHWWGDGVMVASLIWYAVMQTKWLRIELDYGRARAAWYGIGIVVIGLLINLAVAVALGG